MLALSGFSLALLGVMTEPALLRRSEGDEVAWYECKVISEPRRPSLVLCSQGVTIAVDDWC